jgi:protein-S-isoprenylcysteine O-methyltransferase Ste14
MARAFSNGTEQPRGELIAPWTLAVATCVLSAVATASKTKLSLMVGGPLLAAGGLLALISLATLGDKLTLVTEGPYRWVRHPFYLGILVMLVGAVVITRSLVGALLFIPALASTLARAHREEHNLRLRYGVQYEAYCTRAPFILPFRRPAPLKADRDEE